MVLYTLPSVEPIIIHVNDSAIIIIVAYIIGADFAGATGAIAAAVKILRGRRPRGH